MSKSHSTILAAFLAANFQSIFDPASYEDRLKIVRSAYVGSPRKDRYIGEIDRIIRNSSPALAAQVSLIQDPSAPSEVATHFHDLPSLRNKILLLVGAVGCGKSTFVDHLREVSLPEEVKQNTAWVRIDLNPAPVNRDEIYPGSASSSSPASAPLPWTSIRLRSITSRTFIVSRFASSSRGGFALSPPTPNNTANDSPTSLRLLNRTSPLPSAALEQYPCTGRGRLLIIVLNNCDKRDRDEQLLMFQVAKYIQQEIRCLVVLPLRYETFENHRHEPPLDTALKDLVYRIEPPSFHEVLTKPLGLVVSEAKAMATREPLLFRRGKTIQFPVHKLERFLRSMMGSLFDHK